MILLAIYLYSHYLFASLSAHTTALYPAMIAVAAAAGAPPMMVALVFAFFSNFCAGITHFGNGVAPIYFGAGYVSQATWWRNGFIMSLVNYGIWVGIGLVWWKFIGLW
jgi:DASS family divalent anion:Na+ symporter